MAGTAMKMLVTGANGFTGGHLARRLLADGHQVRALVRPGANTDALRAAGIEIVSGSPINDQVPELR